MRKLVILIMMALLMEGCIGVGVYQDPHILPQGKSQLGVGIPFMYVRNGILFLPLPEIYYRRVNYV
jgi:hypothetical protein